eukprot:TRINITY_DN74967_c0_g1_i1.p1 TRINITY_DN74967_c0_g1~~TRINITY_DN74967_c0_g1_i1.p1  ORF type:complete len:377 (-),score=21.66 TRINITY_DN74967_c0_g1_i1:110-1132(-)
MQFTMLFDLFGSTWGWRHTLYVVAVATCVWMGRLPSGMVSDERWPMTCILMPTSLAPIFLMPALQSPMLAVMAVYGLLLFKIGICMSVCFHRYAAHHAFKCGPFTSFVILFLGCLCHQGGPLWWAANHRCHHRFCDVDGDPHSPHVDGVINAFSFAGTHKTIKEDFVPRHCDNFAARVLDTFNPVPRIMEWWTMYALFGATGLWISHMSSFGSLFITSWFNTLNHLEPEADAKRTKTHARAKSEASASDTAATTSGRGQKACRASGVRGNLAPNVFFWCLGQLTSLITPLIGESRHDHHHAFERLARRPGLDIPFHAFVRPLFALGLIWDVKTDAGQDTQ